MAWTSGNDIGDVVYTANGMQREKCFGGMMVGQSGMEGEMDLHSRIRRHCGGV
jgi:hypothetical protein